MWDWASKCLYPGRDEEGEQTEGTLLVLEAAGRALGLLVALRESQACLLLASTPRGAP